MAVIRSIEMTRPRIADCRRCVTESMLLFCLRACGPCVFTIPNQSFSAICRDRYVEPLHCSATELIRGHETVTSSNLFALGLQYNSAHFLSLLHRCESVWATQWSVGIWCCVATSRPWVDSFATCLSVLSSPAWQKKMEGPPHSCGYKRIDKIMSSEDPRAHCGFRNWRKIVYLNGTVTPSSETPAPPWAPSATLPRTFPEPTLNERCPMSAR